MTDLFAPVAKLNLAGWYHLIGFGLIIPLLAWRSRKQVVNARKPLPSRLQHMHSTSVTLLTFGLVSTFVAYRQHISLFAAPHFLPLPLVAGVAMYAAAVTLMRPRWRKAVEKRTPIVKLFMPQTGQERLWWITVAVLAGVTEEITWRGVQTPLASGLVGSVWAGAALSALSFGAGHLIQGCRSALVIVLFALGFQALVCFSGNLYIAMAVHIAYDITAGITYAKLARELGYDPSTKNTTQHATAPPLTAPGAPPGP